MAKDNPGQQSFFYSFRTRVTFIFIFSLLLITWAGNVVRYQHSLNMQFDLIRKSLKIVAKTCALMIDAETINKIPLTHQGVTSPAYQEIMDKLIRIKKTNTFIRNIYVMTTTDKPDIWQFIVDSDPVEDTMSGKEVTAFPGDTYDVSRFPQMRQAFQGPIVDKILSADEWAVSLSAYAPIYDQTGKAVAILGFDVDASKIYKLQKDVKIWAWIILLIGIFISLFIGIIISRWVTRSIQQLAQGIDKIAKGDLGYRLGIKTKDEIGMLANCFNDMASSLAQAKKQQLNYFSLVVQAMVRSLEAKDPYTKGHSDRVSEYSYKTALAMGFSQQQATSLKEAALLHDIGKIGIHEDILNKKGPLSENEWDSVYQHPKVGEEILKPIFFDKQMLAVARSHHECFDGSGYPDKLKGEQINIFAQIVAVADAYDAMTSTRSYRPKMSQEEAIRRIKQASGSQFNPKVVDAFILII